MPVIAFPFVSRRLAQVALLGVLLTASGVSATVVKENSARLAPVQRDVLTLIQLPAFLRARLKLTQAQIRRILTIQNSFRVVSGKMMAEVRSQKTDRHQVANAMFSAQATAERDAEAVLQPSQRATLKSLQEMALRFKGLGRAGFAALAVETLRDDQKSRLQQLAVEAEHKRTALFKALTKDSDRNAFNQGMVALDKETALSVRGALSDDQWKPFDAALKAQGMTPPQ